MAQGYLQHFAPEGITVYSAGVETHGLNPRAVWAMAEDGIDISNHTSNHIDEYADVEFSYVLTVCDHALETCPWFPGGAKKLHHSFSDPSKLEGTEEEIKAAFRKTRGEIKTYCQELAGQL
jgi:arsenate reductase